MYLFVPTHHYFCRGTTSSLELDDQGLGDCGSCVLELDRSSLNQMGAFERAYDFQLIPLLSSMTLEDS